MVDVAMTEAGAEGELVMCEWAGRNTRNDRYRYRRHWREHHWGPFMAETHAMLRYVFKAQYLGLSGVNADVKVFK
jgi:hypothetical protein